MTGLRARRREALEEAIVDAATAIAAEAGVEAVTMAGVAQAVGVTAGALYRYVPSKDALLAAVGAGLVRELAADVVGTEGRGVARVRAAALAWHRAGAAAPERYAVLAMMLASPRVLVPRPEDVAVMMVAAHDAMAPVLAALDEAAAAGELTPAPALERALLLLATVHGVLQLRKQAGRLAGAVDLDGLAAAGVDALLAGWSRPGEA